MNIRTRFAPSPTGYLHIGAVRTALFAWLTAKQNQGSFILRIEDTDKAREVAGAEKHIMESLAWLGLDWDEGPDNGGDCGPYRQSERLEIYQRYAQQLLDQGKAYADTTTPEQLEAWRAEAKQVKKPFHFNDYRPANPPVWEAGMPVRLRIDTKASPAWNDLVRGDQPSSTENIDDFIILKADGYPTYNFAHIVDDHEMKVTHLIRGEEFVSSMPKFLMLYEALEVEPPQFAHLPPILAPSGNKKLSKRDGAPDLLSYRDQGFLPAAIINFLALMGWNDGTEKEIFTVEELLAGFDLKRVQKAGARYDDQRLQWISGHHIRVLPLEELAAAVANFWPKPATSYPEAYKLRVLSLVHERLKYFSELSQLTWFFFEEPQITIEEVLQADKQLGKHLSTEQARDFLGAIIAELETTDFTEEALESMLRSLVDSLNTKTGILFKLVRISITGSPIAPGLFATLSTLGKEQVLKRLANCR